MSKLNTLKHIVDVLKHAMFVKPSPPMLGRWKIDENKNKHLLVDYSNEDHCGTCSQYSIQKQTEKKKIKEDNELYKYDMECLNSNT